MRLSVRLASALAALALVSGATPPPAMAQATCSGFDAQGTWLYARYGQGIGTGNIRVAQTGSGPEVYTTADEGRYWLVLRHDAARQTYEQTFVSTYYPAATGAQANRLIARLELGDVTGDAGDEVVLALANGDVERYDRATKARLGGFPTACEGVTGLGVADLDGDGVAEVVLCNASGLYVYSGDGSPRWNLAGVGGTDLVVAQMDNDAALEIAATNGKVVDATTHAIQFSWPNGFGSGVDAADVDADGRAELIVAETFTVFAYDVERQLPKWSFSAVTHNDVTMADMDGDTVAEVLVGESHNFGPINVYDAVTHAVEGVVPVPDSGVTTIATGDADGDGDLDVLYGSGYSSSGPDRLYVTDWQTRQIGWSSVDLTGPFAGPAIGDLDGDGAMELVTGSYESDSGYGGPRLLVFDARTRRLRGISPEIADSSNYGLRDVRLRDIDRDGRMEILAATYTSQGAGVLAYTFDAANTFTNVWSNLTAPEGGPFAAAEAADIDNDGQIEIVAAMYARNTGNQGIMLFVYDYATRAEEWHSPAGSWPTAAGLEVADVDGDGRLEIVVADENQKFSVYDGVTKALEGTVTGLFTALAVDKTTTPPSIAVGTFDGQLVRYQRSPGPGGSYVETSRRTVSTARVSGVTYDAGGRAWVGSNGRITLYDPASTCLWSSEDYGAGFGGRTVFLPGTRTFFSAGPYAVTGFTSGTGYYQQTVGAYTPAASAWFLRNEHAGGPADAVAQFGPANSGWTPLAGDWNGDGVDTPGLYDAASGFFFLKNSLSGGAADLAFQYGPGGAGYVPLVGDWNGDGVDSVGLYDPGLGAFYLKNANAAGAGDHAFFYGPPGLGWKPVAGDWDADGDETVGLYDPVTGGFYLRNSHAAGAADHVFFFGPGGAGWKPIAGDWDADGRDTIGLYSPADGAYFLRNAHAGGSADNAFYYAAPGLTPLAGEWDAR